MKKVLFFPPTHVSPLPVLLDMPDAAAAALVAAGAGAYPLQLPGDVPPVSTFPLSISGTPAAGMVGSGDTFTPTISGGTPPYSLSVASGALPGGRSIAGLAVTGSYTTAGSFSYTLRATDSKGATADLPVTLTVAGNAAANVVAIGTGGRMATNVQQVTATKLRLRSRSLTRAAGSPYQTFAFPLWYIDDAGVEQVVRLPDGLTAKCQFDVYTNGTIVNAAGDRTGAGTVNGAATFTVANGAAAAATGGAIPYLFCRVDLSGIPLGAAVLAMLEMDAPAANWFMTMTDATSTSTSGENIYYGGTTSIGTFGAMGANGGSAQTRAFRPLVIIGEPTSGGLEPVVAIGDSNTLGTRGPGRPGQDGSSAQSGMAAFGLFQATQPYSVFGKSGDRAAWWNSAPDNSFRFQALAWFKNGRALLNLGTNDLADVPSATDTVVSSALTANVRSLRPKIKAAMGGTARIGQAFILPRVTQQTGFLDAASQTVQTGYANTDAARPAYDAAITADVGVAGRALDFTINPRALVNDPAATDRWKTDGATLHYLEADGTHVNQAGAQAASEAYRVGASA